MPRITSKGQVTLPKRIRERLGINPGDDVDFIDTDGVITVIKQVPASRFSAYRGYLKHLRGRSTDELIEEMRGPVDGLGD